MSLLNINNKIDPNYRYKMQSACISHTGSGKNSNTIINNLDKIADNLGHMGLIILKFISYRFGTNIDKKKKSIKGHYTQSNIQDEIFNYINFFVICSNCEIPELIPQLKIKSKKKTDVLFKCSACGKFSTIQKSLETFNKKTIDSIKKCLEKDEWIIKKGIIVNIDQESITNIKSDNIDIFNL